MNIIVITRSKSAQSLPSAATLQRAGFHVATSVKNRIQPDLIQPTTLVCVAEDAEQPNDVPPNNTKFEISLIH